MFAVNDGSDDEVFFCESSSEVGADCCGVSEFWVVFGKEFVYLAEQDKA